MWWWWPICAAGGCASNAATAPAYLPFRMLAERRPGASPGSVLRVLRCRDCGQRVARVVLVDDPADGAAWRPAPGGWRIEITFPELPAARA